MIVRGRCTRWWASAALLGSLALRVGPLRADPAPLSEAEAFVQRGIDLRKARKNAEALSEFQKAYAIAPTARTEAQIALALHALGDWLGAERGLEHALGAADDPWIVQYRGALEGALATVRAHLASLFVSVNVPAGELVVNGVSVRTVPFSDAVRVAAGTLDVAVRAPGYVAGQRTIDIAPGSESHQSFTLEPVSAPPTPPSPPAAGVGSVGPPVLRTAPAAATSVGARATLGYASLGAAGVFAAGGFVAWRAREDNAAVYNDNSRCLVGTLTRGERCGSYASAADEAFVFELAAFGAAAAATGLGAWLLLGGRPQARVAWCSPSSPMGIACGGQF
jgi:tetratricopeptide (TPR) repeat protein